MDWTVNRNARAGKYIRSTLGWIVEEWKRHGKLPAAVLSSGAPGAEYQSLEMVSGLMAAVEMLDPRVATEMNAKLQEAYSNGFWDGKESYYLQNWAWFGTALYQKRTPL